MRATILPWAIILTKAHSVAVSIMAKGNIMALVLPLRCFLFFLPNYTNISVCYSYLHYLEQASSIPS